MEKADNLCSDTESIEFVRQLVERDYDVLYKAALHRLDGDIDAADSCIQQMLEIALRKADVVKAHKNPDGWLAKVLQNCMKKYKSKAGNAGMIFVSLDEIEYLLHVSPPEFFDYDDEYMDAAKARVLAKLTDDELHMYRLRYEEGLTVKEVAEKVGSTVPSAKCKLYRIRLKVGELVKQEIPY